VHIQTLLLTSRRLDSLLYEAAQNFESFFQKFNTKIKKSKTLTVDDFFKGLSNDTTLMQIQSGQTVLWGDVNTLRARLLLKY
jgi:hypothetical protein